MHAYSWIEYHAKHQLVYENCACIAAHAHEKLLAICVCAPLSACLASLLKTEMRRACMHGFICCR
jgi:hypothetical protein